MLNQKQVSYLLFFSIVSGLLMIYCLQNITMKNENVDLKHISLSDYMNYFYLNSKPKFDYLNGLWLMFMGCFMFCILAILELPTKFEILKLEFKIKYYKKKIKKELMFLKIIKEIRN